MTATRHVRRARKAAIFASAVTFVALAGIGATPANALPGGSYFELDGNAVDSPAGGSIDWSTIPGLCDVTTPCPAPTVASTGIINDLPADLTGADSTYFQGGGSKDDLDIPSWGTGGNSAPDKNELTNAYAVATRNGAGNLVVVFGADRYDNSGSAQMGFWLLQQTVSPNNTTGKFVNDTGAGATHVVGDVLVLSDFTNGGQLGQIVIYKWVGAGNGDSGSNDVLLKVGSAVVNPTKANPDPVNPADCTYTGTTPPPNNNLFCATINKVGGEAAPWPYKAKDAPGNHSSTTFPARSFIEGAVNIGALTGGQCFASFLAETRTAPEIQGAQLKDYALGRFAVCQPSTTMTASGLAMTASPNPAATGQTVTFTAFERNDGTDPLTAPAGGFVQSTDCSPWVNTAGDTNTNGVLDPGETWTFTCSTSFSTSGVKTVTVVGHGLDARFGNKDVTVCATPTDPGKICDPQETNSTTVNIINPSTDVTFTGSTPAVRTIHSGESVVLTFTEANDATGSGNVLSPPTPGDKNSFLTADNGCTPAFVSGDTDGDNKLDPGETFTYTCTVNPTADVTITATGHGIDALGRDVTFCTTSSATQFCDADERDSASINVINPSTSLTGSGSALVTLTWVEANDALQADEVLTNPSVTADNGCSPVSKVDSITGKNIGDTDGDGKLDAGESWTFTCQITVNPSSSVTVTGIGHGTDATGTEVTFCAVPDATKVCDAQERAQVTITVS